MNRYLLETIAAIAYVVFLNVICGIFGRYVSLVEERVVSLNDPFLPVFFLAMLGAIIFCIAMTWPGGRK